MDKFVSSEFLQHVDQEVSKCEGKANVRGEVKKVLTYPHFSYPPWRQHEEISSETLEEINEETKDVKFRFEIVEGKVYAKCISEKKLSDVVFEKLKLKNSENMKGFRINSETCHVTIINSNVVAEIGERRIQELVDYFNLEFHLITGKIMSAFSEDWSRFGDCYVIEIDCGYIDNFLVIFNEKFGREMKIAKYVTFAIKPRSLWE